MHTTPFKNLVLLSLPADSIRRLCLRPIPLNLRFELQTPDRQIDRIVFVEEGVISTTVQFQDGSQVEVGLDGCESAVGISALLGSEQSFHHVYAQISGHGQECSLADAKAEFERNGEFHSALLRCAQGQQLQAMQSAACNAKHGLEQRLTRWLLLVRDRAQTDKYKLSHEFLAEMLGCSRPALSRVAAKLSRAERIRSVRGTIQVLDFEGLEEHACECYHIMKDQLKLIRL